MTAFLVLRGAIFGRFGPRRKERVGLRRREAWSAVCWKGSIRTRVLCRKPGIYSIATTGTMHRRHGVIDGRGQKRLFGSVAKLSRYASTGKF